MEYWPLAIHFSALLVAVACIAVASRLQRQVGDPFLSDYVVFLVLSALWGFVLWTAPGLIGLQGAAAAPAGLSVRAVTAIKWFGFPFHLLQLYFLVLVLGGLTGVPIPRRFQAAYFAVSSSLVVVLLVAMLRRMQWFDRDVFRFLHAAVTYAYLAFQWLAFLWAVICARSLRDRVRRRTAAGFAGLYLAGFSIYLVLSHLDLLALPVIAFLFSAVHVPSLWFLRVEFGWRPRTVSGSPVTGALERFGDRYGLSPRERDVVRLLLEGKSNRQMEEALFISLQTVKNYVSRIYRKLEVQNRLELMNRYRTISDWQPDATATASETPRTDSTP